MFIMTSNQLLTFRNGMDDAVAKLRDVKLQFRSDINIDSQPAVSLQQDQEYPP